MGTKFTKAKRDLAIVQSHMQMDDEDRPRVIRAMSALKFAGEMYEMLSNAADSLYQSSVEGDINLAGDIRELLVKARGEQ